ncbi:alpha/beta hydrolase [Phytomonospora endophytica]|uniref:Acyl-CoA:diacylglycerol acyltransferase n=1 Tax=Phytomonospora endophytica TaxID=714109 RepID=A0A841FTR1_9ACTN|nr:alpha/beta hydrolase-fold protein [Phytomonospora endophytica]MBB6036932.1 enterochelin esterase-like enzyme [Phytomonospora endophytica]GIG68037.1 esterase [Phytomonospora endophytica]
MSSPVTRRAAITAGLAAAGALAVPAAASASPARREGTLTTAAAPSPVLGEDIAYIAYLPYGYRRGRNRYPVVYLLHGRGDDMTGWSRMKPVLDELIAEHRIPPVIAVMPDAQYSEAGGYYVDSAFTGTPAGRPVETAFTTDLIAHVDGTYRTRTDRASRLVGGYSMGGAGALRYVLAHQDLFAAALVLSPAVYTPTPPADSSVREFGAFGDGETRFAEEVYLAKNYPALLATVDTALPVHTYVAVGDDEWANPDPADFRHDLDFEAAVVHNHLKRTPGVSTEFRVLGGGHDWDVWEPAFADGLPHLFTALGEA